MSQQQQRLQEVLEFLKEHRSNEGNFEKIYAKLEEEAGAGGPGPYVEELRELKDKQAETYRQHKAEASTAWPEFEKFVSGFEKAITSCLAEER